jgi:hypothetical protein
MLALATHFTPLFPTIDQSIAHSTQNGKVSPQCFKVQFGDRELFPIVVVSRIIAHSHSVGKSWGNVFTNPFVPFVVGFIEYLACFC